MATRAFSHWIKRALDSYALATEAADIDRVTVQRDLSILVKFKNGDKVYLVQMVREKDPNEEQA